ncbi:hypothetical protein POM88_050727 [Heracleum sosnowskyi]|uniref:DUF4283 domain-containing protein n=1 Tax=Heracleum sosnowskyi TaxID=360622 RepID=A0AAD8GZ96_9APIA|nr:hypothetical protein POM88_050727 [Heracleum sosnowskyi]
MSDPMKEIVCKTNKLLVENEEEWEVNQDDTEDPTKKALVGRILAKKQCNKKFIRNVFKGMWKTKEKWEVKVLKYDNRSTYVGFSFEEAGDKNWVKEKMPWNSGTTIKEGRGTSTLDHVPNGMKEMTSNKMTGGLLAE